MTHALYRRSAFGVCLVAILGLMAVTATGAQAGEEWLIEGAAAPNQTPIHAAIHPLPVTLKKHIVFLVPALKLEVLCSDLTSDDGLLIQNTLILILLLFKTCESLVNGTSQPKCKPAEPIDLSLLGHLFLHGELKKLTYILFESDKIGSPIGTITLPGTCAIAETSNLTGTFVAECLSEKLETKEKTGIDYCLQEMAHHLIQQAPEKLFEKHMLKFGANQALIDGIIDLLLSGANEGRTWSGHV